MFTFIVRTLITGIGILFGNLLIINLEKWGYFSLYFNNFSDDLMLEYTVHFGIIFCIGAIFFLASSFVSVAVNNINKRGENLIDNLEPVSTASSLLGLILGLTASFLMYPILSLVSPKKLLIKTIILILTYTLISALIMRFSKKAFEPFFTKLFQNNALFIENLNPSNKSNQNLAEDKNIEYDKLVIIDTNIFIDGRIIKLIKSGIFAYKIAIPDFVLNELQFLADSVDELTRKKGRRGLDLVDIIVKDKKIPSIILNTNQRGKVDVDNLLIETAKKFNSPILTNDYNLCKNAKVRNIDTINLNDVATALKPEFLPGEKISIKPIKAGKTQGQSIAYLDDGTMVVIENGFDMIGKEIDVIISESIQNAQGKMIFAKFEEEIVT